MLQYVLVRQLSQANFTEHQLISCLCKGSHYTEINSKLWSCIWTSFTLYNKNLSFVIVYKTVM